MHTSAGLPPMHPHMVKIRYEKTLKRCGTNHLTADAFFVFGPPHHSRQSDWLCVGAKFRPSCPVVKRMGTGGTSCYIAPKLLATTLPHFYIINLE